MTTVQLSMDEEIATVFEERQQISKQQIDKLSQSFQWWVEAVVSQPGC